MPAREQHTFGRLSPEQRLREANYRAAFGRLCADLAARPEPRGYFDRPLCGRTSPWEHVMLPIRIAVAAGQTYDNATELPREMLREIGSYFPDPADTLTDATAILLAEGIREAELRVPKIRALASRLPADIEAAADALEREAREDLIAAQALRRHARSCRTPFMASPGARPVVRGVSKRTRTGTLLEAVR